MFEGIQKMPLQISVNRFFSFPICLSLYFVLINIRVWVLHVDHIRNCSLSFIGIIIFDKMEKVIIIHHN